MSLRREIHSAFDVITPPLGGMPERVVQTMLADKRRRRKENVVVRLRVPLSLVAVFIAIVLVAAALVAGRVITDWNTTHHPAPAGHVSIVNLEARPITLPTVKTGEACPQSPSSTTRGYQYGTGPVYANGAGAITTTWGNYFDITYYTDGNLKGPVLIRGRDLRDQSRIVVFVGTYATGPLVGNDQELADGAQHSEALLDASNPPARRAIRDGIWLVRQGAPASASNCFGFQFDGPTFSETFTGGS